MTREDRLKTHIRVGRLGIEPSTSLLSEHNGDCFDMVMWDKDAEGQEYCWVIASLEKDKEGNSYLKTCGDRIFDENIEPGELHTMMKLMFELEKM